MDDIPGHDVGGCKSMCLTFYNADPFVSCQRDSLGTAAGWPAAAIRKFAGHISGIDNFPCRVFNFSLGQSMSAGINPGFG